MHLSETFVHCSLFEFFTRHLRGLFERLARGFQHSAKNYATKKKIEVNSEFSQNHICTMVEFTEVGLAFTPENGKGLCVDNLISRKGLEEYALRGYLIVSKWLW